jgi:hypothetical protein
VPRPEHGVDRILAVQDPGMFARAFARISPPRRCAHCSVLAPTAW